MLLAALLLAASPLAQTQAEAREILNQLLRVDTSHGNETRALEPLVERFRKAGLEAQLVESSPGRGNLIARLKGTGKKRPLLLVAHIDVVPVEGQSWRTPPFTPTEDGGYLVARGVSDDKAMASAIAALALELGRSKEKLSRDVIVALTAGEETGGNAGVRFLVEHKRELIDAELALNEGASITLSPDEQRIQSVGLGVAEKTFQSFRLSVRGKGGHSSVPPTDTDPVLVLARALVKVGELRFRMHVLPEVRDQLAASGEHEEPPLSQAMKHAAQTAPLVAPPDEQVLAADRLANALVRTTCVTTMLQASPQDNVLPVVAQATVNCRILPDETAEGTQRALEKAIGDDAVRLEPTTDFGNGGRSPSDGEVPRAVRSVVHRLWGAVPVTGVMGTGATDSRYLRQIGIAAYGVATAPGTQSDTRNGYAAHGANERRPVRWMGEGVRFLRELVLQLAR